jgi:hypothetical protein
MVASLVRLLHSGPQDQRLLPKGGPTDVKAYVRVLTRAGRMTTQWSRLDFQQKPTLGQQAFCTLQRKGELITRLYLVATMPDIATPQLAAKAAAGANFVGPTFSWTNSLGHALVQQLVLDIGGTRMDTMDSRLLEALDEFNTPLEKVLNVNAMIKRFQNGFPGTSVGGLDVAGTQVIVPLPFWFSRGDLGAALPIDALNVDEVRVGVTFRGLNGLYYTESRAPAAAIVPTTEGSALWPLAGSSFYKNDTTGSVVPGLAPSPPSGFASKISGITMPLTFELGDTFLLAEYVYLDKAEANRFRQGNIELPVTQYTRIEPRDTQRFRDIRMTLELANPTRHLYIMAQNYDAIPYNAYFLATRTLTGPGWTRPAPWWPDASGLQVNVPGDLVPAFSTRGSEPFASMEIIYEGSYVKTSTDNCALYRSILPSYEERKSPWHNRYMYCIPFGVQSGYFPPSTPMGECNMNRIMKKELRFGFVPDGSTVQRLWVYVWAETYNVLRIYGGRATFLFSR